MIAIGENKATLYKGDFHPAALYKGDKKIAGYTVEEFESENGVTLENCYNDKLYNAQIIGNTVQDGTPTPENPVEIQSVGELVTEGEYTGKYKIPVRARGKNLLSINEAEFTTIQRINFENPLAAGAYTISGIMKSERTDNYMLIRIMNGSVQLGAEGFIHGITGRQNRSFTTTDNNAANSKNVKATMSEFMLEKDSTVTPYEPYIEPQTFNIYLDEPLRKVRDYVDYVDFGNKKTIRKNKAITNLNSNKFTQYGDIVVPGNPLSPVGVGSLIDARAVMCSHDSKVEFSNAQGTKVGFTLSRNGIDYKSETALEEWTQLYNSWIESGKFLLQYALNTPIEEPIDLPELPTFKGTTIYEIDTDIPATISGKYKKLEE